MFKGSETAAQSFEQVAFGLDEMLVGSHLIDAGCLNVRSKRQQRKRDLRVFTSGSDGKGGVYIVAMTP